MVNGRPEEAGVLLNETRSDRSVAVIVLDDRLEARLAAEEPGSRITATAPADANIVIGQLNSRLVKRMEQQQAVVQIRAGNAIYTIPAEEMEIDAVREKLGHDIPLEDIAVQIEIAEPTEAQMRLAESAAENGTFALVAAPVQFTVRAVHQDAVVEITRFSVYVERAIALPDGIGPEQATTGVMVEQDGTVRHVPTRIVQADGTYYAVLHSLTNSLYTVVRHPVAFRDMEGHWAEAVVNELGSRMIASGVGDVRFTRMRESPAPSSRPCSCADWASGPVRGTVSESARLRMSRPAVGTRMP